MVRRLPVLWLSCCVAGCHNFDDDYAACVDAGRCAGRVTADAGGEPLPDGGYPGCATPDDPANQFFGAARAEDAGFTMYGCAGSTQYSYRNGLCSGACFPCSVYHWLARSAAAPAPRWDYWTNDRVGLAYADDAGVCTATYAPVGGTCTEASLADGGVSTAPMRICAQSGSACELTGCGFLGGPAVDSFGGCGSAVSAGALCCCD
jgi:hypothetical protein